jgi:hypothetical protein
MTFITEKNLKLKIKAHQEGLPGIWRDSPVRNGYNRKGPPDTHGCCFGFFFGIEVKATGGVPDAWQERELKAISEAGGFAMYCDSWEGYLSYFMPFYENCKKFQQAYMHMKQERGEIH